MNPHIALLPSYFVQNFKEKFLQNFVTIDNNLELAPIEQSFIGFGVQFRGEKWSRIKIQKSGAEIWKWGREMFVELDIVKNICSLYKKLKRERL